MRTAHDTARVFNALGDPTRRAIVERASQGAVSVSDLAKPLKMTLAAVGQHVQVLEASGLVHTKKPAAYEAAPSRRRASIWPASG